MELSPAFRCGFLCKAISSLSSGLGVGRAVRSWLSVVQTSVVCSWCSLKSSSTSGYPTLFLQLAVVLQLSPQPPPTRPPGTHQRTKKKRSSATIAWIPDHAGRRYECKVRHVDIDGETVAGRHLDCRLSRTVDAACAQRCPVSQTASQVFTLATTVESRNNAGAHQTDVVPTSKKARLTRASTSGGRR